MSWQARIRTNALHTTALSGRHSGSLVAPPRRISRTTREWALASASPLLPQPQPPQQRRDLAGHNKWSKIRHKKGAKDVARAAQFGKASRAITAAARACGGDRTDLRLQSAIAHARALQLPKDRIAEAVARSSHKEDEVDVESVRYDAVVNLGGTKVSCILQALTDNRSRTFQQIRPIIGKAGGEILPTSKLNFLFTYVGQVLLENVTNEDGLYECAVEGGATEIEMDGNSALATCEASDLWQLVTALKAGGYQPSEFEQRYVLQIPDSAVALTDEGREQLDDFLDKLDQNEDVSHVYHNAKIDASVSDEKEEESR